MTTQEIDWPAWVQAVGTVLALFLTGGLAVWEAHRRRLEDRALVAEQLRARVAVLEFAFSNAASFLDLHRSDARKRSTHAMASYASLKNAFNVANLVTVLDMPNRDCVNAFFMYTAGVDVFRRAIELNEPDWLMPWDIQRLEAAFDGIAAAVVTIRDQADRISA